MSPREPREPACIASECFAGGPETAEGAALGVLTVLGLLMTPGNAELGKRGAFGILDHVCEAHRPLVREAMRYAIAEHGGKRDGAPVQ